jgi:bifunctional DNase/RNase
MEKKGTWIELSTKAIFNPKKFYKWRKLFISNPQYIIVLSKKDESSKGMKMLIGQYEAQNIAIAIEKMTPARPLTHDLIKTIAEGAGLKLESIVIDREVDNNFYASMYYLDKDNKALIVDSRPSDAIAIALRFNCSIFVEKVIFDKHSTSIIA